MQPNDGAATPAESDRAEHVRELTRDVLRCALRTDRYGRMVNGELGEMLRRTCDSAQRRGLHAEQLLVMLKEAWHDLPEARQMARQDAAAALSRVITLCIQEYYAPRHRE